MKKIFKYMFLLAGLFAVSCSEDTLEPYTPGTITEEVAIQNSNDLRQLLNTCYAFMYNREEVVFNSVFTDEAGIGFANGGQGIINDDAYFYFTLNANSPVADEIWTGNYFALSRINRVIKFADLIVPANAADALKIQRVKAEALTLRALAHLRIMSYYSQDLTNDASLAGILADHVFEVSEKENPRATNGQFYSLIQTDLTNAIALYDSSASFVPPSAATTIASKRLAMGLKARAYSFKGDYVNATNWANQVLASGIVLAPKAEYTKIFFTDNEAANTEVIFRLKRTLQQSSQAANLGNGYASVNTTLSGSPFFEIGRSLYNILNPTNIPQASITDLNIPDVRYKTIVHPTTVNNPNYATSTDYLLSDKLVLGKLRGGGTVGELNADYKVMRLSEMVLIKAEAAAFNSDFPAVAGFIKTIKDVRVGPGQIVTPPTSKADAYKMVLRERRIEFAFEGYRFLDLKRMGTLAGVGIDRDFKDYENYPAGNPSFLPISSYKFTLPIPTDETIVNPGIVRNPGY